MHTNVAIIIVISYSLLIFIITSNTFKIIVENLINWLCKNVVLILYKS